MIMGRSQTLLIASVVLIGLTGAVSAQAQCVGTTTTIYWVNGVIRTAGNNVQTNLGTQIVGDYSDTWEASVTASETFQGVTIHPSTSASVGFGGNDWTNYPPGASATAAGYTYNDTPSSLGPGTFTATSSHVAQSECGNKQVDSQTQQYTVIQPTIGGFSSTRAYWNLGPGSNDPQETAGGYYFYQSTSLTFETNCGSGDTCSDTPQWNLTTSSNQALLSSTSGSTTTLEPGSTPGNCQYVSTLTANIGGFSTLSYTIAYDSPASMGHVNGELTSALPSGYQTAWSISFFDACNPANTMLPLPRGETFPSGFTLVNGGSGTWAVPSPGTLDYTQWASTYYTYDYISQEGVTQVPPVLYDRSGPPYTGNTVYFQGAHTVNVGAQSGTSGTRVYNGTLRYYTDHGDNNP